jgi:hypothetical protein
MQHFGFMANALRVLPQQMQMPSLNLGLSAAAVRLMCSGSDSVAVSVEGVVGFDSGSWNVTASCDSNVASEW